MKKNDIDIPNKQLLKILEGLNQLPRRFKEDTFTKMAVTAHVQFEFNEDFFNLDNIYQPILEPFYDAIEKNIPDMPSTIFRGLSENQFLKKYPRPKNNAKLKGRDVRLFFKLYFGLLDFTNQTYHISPSLNDIHEGKALPHHLMIPIRDFLFANPYIIDEFLKKNPLKLSYKKKDSLINSKNPSLNHASS